MTACWLQQRRAGVLLHPTSLPNRDGQGDLGPAAHRFVDYLAAAGFSVWQMLPVGPVHDDRSPYLPRSSFAGHTGLISPAGLRDQGLIDTPATTGADDLPERRGMLTRAWRVFQHDADAAARSRFERFVASHASWLPDYALFRTLGLHYEDRPWFQWPTQERTADQGARERLRRQYAEEVDFECFGQYLFFEQWARLHAHARSRGIELFGDLPIYVAHDSSDVWCRPQYFMIDASGQPEEVAGVPPDAFAETGQRWGNPLYDWQRLEADGHRWWIERFRGQYELFDMLRVDHFRGFESYWAIPGDAPTAESGRWRPGPGRNLFDRVIAGLGKLRLVAEDLGSITPEVDTLRRHYGFPGMRVLQFGFEGGADNPHRPANHIEDAVAYTGTHDNDTTLGWWQALDETRQRRVLDHLGHPDLPIDRALVQAALSSVCRLAVLPMQDLLGLGAEARMNTPGTARGNWSWQLDEGVIDADPEPWIRHQIEDGGRLPS